MEKESKYQSIVNKNNGVKIYYDENLWKTLPPKYMGYNFSFNFLKK